jgi:hypothetical protein
MGDRARFTATIAVGKKFDEVFNDILKLPKYDLHQNCMKITGKGRKFVYACFGMPPRGYAEIKWGWAEGQDAVDVLIDGDEGFVMAMMLMINEVLRNHGFSLIDDKYSIVWL